MSHSGTALVMADVQGVITAWTGAAAEFFGFDAADVVGQRLDVIVPPDYRVAHWTAFDRAMQTGQCGADRAAFLLPVLQRDGQVGLFPARFIFLTDASGNAAGAVVILSPRVESGSPFGPVG
jgi:PAS domain S-box-containing protein